jgi:Protein of unknown function (DUF1064)
MNPSPSTVSFFKKLSSSKGSKYKNQVIIKNGITFDSKLESSFDDFFMTCSSIKLIDRQVAVELLPSHKNALTGQTIRGINYVADFLVKFNDTFYLVDSKGFETAEFKLKYKLVLWQYSLGKCPYLIVAKTTKDLITQLENLNPNIPDSN